MRILPAGGIGLFKQRDFVCYLLARLFGNLGAQMQTVAIGWQVYDKTHNPLDLGLIGLSQFAPFMVLILPAGQVADRFDRRRIVAICYAIHVLCALALGMYTWLNMRAVWPVFSIMTLLGVARAFATPAMQALLPNLVPREQFSRSIALSSMVLQSTTLMGPTVGGLLLLLGLQSVYAAVIVSYLLCSLAIGAMRYQRPEAVRTQAATPEPVAEASLAQRTESLLMGLKFVRAQPLVLGSISLDLFAVLLGGATALLPIYASDILKVGPSGLGMLRSATGAGAVMAALWLSAFPITRHVGRWLFGGVLMFGVATIVFGLSNNFMVSMLALAMLGASDMVSVFVRRYLVQLVTPDAIRGRVSAVSGVFIGASNELGEFESGVTAAWWGAVAAVTVGGSATILITLLWMKWFPQLRRMDKFPQVEQ